MLVIEMNDGKVMKFELDPENAPITCANMEKLANEGFYDGLIFHRIIKDFMIQGGDPEGTGIGGSDEEIKGEFIGNGVVNNHKHKRGTISMARAQCLYMDSLCSHHAEIQYLYLIYTVYNVIILPFHSCKKKRAPFTALFHIDFLIHLSYSTVCQPMSLNFFPKMG